MFYPRVSTPRPTARSRSPYEEPVEDSHGDGDASNLPHIASRYYLGDREPNREFQFESDPPAQDPWPAGHPRILYGQVGYTGGDCDGPGDGSDEAATA